MSRLLRAWTESWAVARAVSSLTSPSWVATALVFLLAFSPAIALGRVGSPHGGTSVALATGSAQADGVTPSTSGSSERSLGGLTSAGDPNWSRQVLSLGSGYWQRDGSGAVSALQRRLSAMGYSPGPVDGRFGPLTEGAVARFQAGHGLRIDGIAGPLTLAAVVSVKPALYPGEGYVRGGSAPVRKLQRGLAAAGFAPGPIDGRYGPLTERAVRRFQATHHLAVDGIAGSQTLGHLPAFVVGGAHHQPIPALAGTRPAHVRPRTGPAHVRPRPLAPPSTGARGRTTGTSPALHQPRRPSGSLPIVWIIVLAYLLAALLAVALWRMRPRRDRQMAPAELPATGRGETLEAHEGAQPHEDLSEGRSLSAGVEEWPAAMSNGSAEAEREDHARGIEDRREQLAPAADDRPLGAEQERTDRPPGAEAFMLGWQRAREGDRAGAKEAFRRADERGHAAGAFELGALLAEEGDRAGAKDAFGRADERGHPSAAFDLGALLLQDGDDAGAEDAFRRADARGDAAAASNLGVLLEQRGDFAAAREAYRRADERGHAVGADNLGTMLEQDGDPIGAMEAYRRADRRGDPLGAYHLGVMLEREGDREGAKEAYQRADELGNPDAACNLGLMLHEEGDQAGAVQAFQRAEEQGSGEVAELAQAALLELVAREGRAR